MNIIGIQLICSGIIFISTFLCSTFPIFLFSLIENREKRKFVYSQSKIFSLKSIIKCFTCFGGGIFLGACFIDLLPEVIHHFNFIIEKEFSSIHQSSKHYPIAEFFIGLGIFLVLFIEQSILSCHTVRERSIERIDHQNQNEERTTQIDDEDPLIESNSRKENQFEIIEPNENFRRRENRLVMTRNSIFLFSLIIHSIFEGVALGSTNEKKAFLEIFFAIILHKSIIAFSVGLKLMKFSIKHWIYFSCFILSISTPIGIFIVLTMEKFLPENLTAKILHEIFRAFACGTFVYITFFDVLPHELNLSRTHQHNQITIPDRCRLVKVLFIFVGFLFVALLSFVMK